MDEMSPEAKALVADITARIDSMSEAEREDFQNNIRELFQTPSVVIDGETCESLILEFEVITGEQHEYYRYTFYENDANWQLYMIEKGGYTIPY